MPDLGGVWYSETAFDHMRQIAEQTCIDPAQRHGKTALLNEAEVIHAFHEEFPGVVMRDVSALDGPSARAATDEAILRVDQAADPDWKSRALEAVHAICLTTDVFTPDNIWERIEKPREPRALGPVMLRARRQGWCEPTGRFVKSQAPTQHQNPITEYRSLIA